MLKKILVVLFLAAFSAGFLVTKPLNLSDIEASEPISTAINGKIRVVSTPLSGITVRVYTVINHKRFFVDQTTTNVDGNYNFSDLQALKYIVKPVSKQYSFNPINKVVDFTGCDINCAVVGIDFQAIPR